MVVSGMATAAHSSGPWYMSRSDRYVRHDRDGFNIADLSVFGGPSDEGEANARLIVASPDLLSVCRELLAMDNETGMIPLLDARQRLEGAIMLATGKRA